MRPSRAAAALLTALLTGGLLAGCAEIPTTGPVRQGAEVGGQRDVPFIRVIARPPRPGLSEQGVVAGFLEASASFDNDHAVARAYLAPEVRDTWKPAAGTTLYDDTSLEYESTGRGGVSLLTRQVATISVRGEYTAVNPVRPLSASFVLRRVGEEWRIAALPPGLLLTRLDVDRAFRTFDLYFPDPTRTVLVPNPVLLPVGPGVSTTLVRALLAGPTPWLAPAVRTAFPPGTQLTVDSAPIRDGVVQVDLNGPAAEAAGSEIRALSAQLVWTMRQLGDVSGVRISVLGVPLSVPGVGVVQSRDSWPTVDPDVLGPTATGYLVARGRLVELRGADLLAVPGPAGDGRTPLTAPAVAPGGDLVAGLDAERRQLLMGQLGAQARIVPVLTAASLTPPAWDVLGTVWTADRPAGGPSVVWATRLDDKPTPVTLEGLPAGRVEALVPARDGARVAVVVRGPAGGRVFLGRVVRDGARVTVSGFRPIESSLVDVRDAAWSTANRLIVLGRVSGGVDQPYVIDLTGLVERALGALSAEIVSIAAAPGRPVLVATADGRVWQYSGFEWARLAEGSDPTYPG